MSGCNRYEEEALLALEQGRELPAHFRECADCRERAAGYTHLQALIRDLHAEARPQEAWQQAVLAEIDRKEKGRQPVVKPERRGGISWLGWLRIATPLAAAAVLALLYFFPPSTSIQVPPLEPSLLVELRSGTDMVMRGTEAKPGDVVVLEAASGEFAYAQLRVYLNDRETVLSCADETPCERTDEGIRAELTLPTAGTYQPALFLSNSPLPEPRAGLDQDAEQILRQGGRVLLDLPLDVR